MSKASLNYFQAFHVGKVKTDVIQFTTIQAAIDAITDNTSSKRYAVYVHPGIYTEVVTMEDYVDVIAVGGREETVITHTCAGHDEVTVTAENALIKGFTIVSDGATGTLRARCVNAGIAGFEMEDCILTPQNTAAVTICFYASLSCDIRDCVIDSAAASAIGALFTSAVQTYNIQRTSFNAGTDAIQTTGAITAFNLEDCTVSNNLLQNGGTISIKRCSIEAIVLNSAPCTFTAELSRFTSTFATADAFAHTITCHNCSFSGQNFTNAATGATVITLRGCDGISTLTNAGIGGTLTLYETGVDTLTTTAGTVVAYGGRIGACGGSTGTSFVWWKNSNELLVMANMKIANALAVAGAGDTIMVGPGTYAENLIMVASVHLVGIDRTQCVIEKNDGANAIIASAVAGVEIRNLTISNTNAGQAGLAVSANTLQIWDCTISGAASSIAMTGGTLVIFDSILSPGTIALSTAICSLNLRYCRLSGAALTTAGAFAHVMSFEHCEFSTSALTSNATAATTLALNGCTRVGAITNAGTGAFTIRDSDVSSINGTGAGANTFYGGYLGTVTRAVGATVWWKNDNELWVLPSATTTDPMVASALAIAASGDVVHVCKGTFAESALVAKNGVDIVGEGKGISSISKSDGANPIIAVGTGVSFRIHSLSITNAGANNAINLAAVAGNAVVYLTDCYVGAGANGVSLNTTGAGLCGLYCIDTEFSITTTAIIVAGAVGHIVDVKNCTFVCTNVITFTGANHTFDAVDCECGGGAVTVTANVPPINMTRCNDVGAITNLTNALTLEHCTTGAITNTTGTVVIEHCNTGLLNISGAATVTVTASTLQALTVAAGTTTVTNSSMAAISVTAGGTLRLIGGCSFASVAALTPTAMTWKTAPQVYEVCNGMRIADALTAAAAETPSDTFRFEIRIHPGEYVEALTCVQFVDLIGDSSESCVITFTNSSAISAAANMRIKGLRVEVNGTDDAVILINNVAGVIVESCHVILTWVGGANSGINISGTSGAIIKNCYIEATNVTDKAINVSSTGTVELRENVLNGGLADILMNADVTGDLQTWSNQCKNAGFRIADNNLYNVYAHGDIFKKVTFVGVSGHMFLQNEPNVAIVRKGMKIVDAIALANADTPSATNPWTVEIGAGVYEETVACVAFVHLKGIDKDAVIIQQTNADVITLASNVHIENVTVRVVTPDAARTLIKDNAAACTGVKLSNVVLSITTPGAFADLGVLLSGGSTIVMERCSATWVAGTGAEIVLSVTTAASTVLVDGCNFSNTNVTAGSLINSAFAGTVITVVDSRLAGTVTHLVASAGIIRVSNSQYRSVARSATGNIVDESPELKDTIWHTMKKIWEVITAAVYNARIAGAGTVVLGGAGQVTLTITNAAADVAGTESAVDAAGSLQSSLLPAQTPRYVQQLSVSAFAVGADGNRQFYGLRETLGGAIPNLAAEECAGFDWNGTNFRAVSSDGVTGEVTNLATPSTGAQHQFEVIVFGGVKVEFYVDGKLVATHSTAAGLPAVLLDWQELIHGLGTGATSAGVVTVRAGGVQECAS